MALSKSMTSFKPGSLFEMLMMALPLVMVSLSENIMIFFDRVILAHYSLASLNAVTLASQSIEVGQYALWSIASMAEIVVARLYAKGQLHEIAKPCWQMIYLSLAIIPVIIVLSMFLGKSILPNQYLNIGLGYFKISIYTIPLIGMITAISAYFVGQGKLKLIVVSTIFINILNLMLDYMLVFGCKPWFHSYGAKGPAISAVISLSLQAAYLFCAFVYKQYRNKFLMHKLQFNYEYFSQIMKIGVPVSLCHVFELLGWVFIFKMIATTNVRNFTILSMGSTLFLIYSFVNDGLYRSLTTVVSNHIASKNNQFIQKSLLAALFILSIFLLFSLIPLLLVPKLVISMFHLQQYTTSWQGELRLCLLFMWFYFTFIGIYWVFAAVLTAYHKTKIILIGNTLCFWLLAALPIFYIVKYSHLYTLDIWLIISISAIVGCISIVFYYFNRLKHKHIDY